MNSIGTPEEIINKINRLPEQFLVAIKVARMLDGYNLDLDIQELTRVISLDQSLTSLLLKLCNSAHYGFSRKITSIQDAVTKLGFKIIKSLVFVAVSQGILNQEIQGYSLAKGDLWKNSVSCAVYARFIAKTTGYKDPETAFTAGLLRDIGKLMIHEYVGNNYNEIIKLVNSEGISFVEAENQIMGFNHCYIGSEMAMKWNFPPVLVDVIKHHHNPASAIEDECSDIDLVYIIHIADSLAMLLGSGIGNDGLMYSIDLSALKHLKISHSSDNIENLVSEAVDLNDEIESMISIVSENK